MTAVAPLAPAGTGTELPEPAPPAGGAKSRLGILVLPALLMFLAFAFIPLIGVLVLSFTDWDGISAIQFAGWQSWVQVLTDPGTWHALWLTFALMIITWLVQTPISLLLGTFIAGLHLPFLAQDWLGNPTLAFITVVFVIAWQFIPFHTLLYQGGVRQIPEQMYEAAQIDGAGRIRQFFSITVPQLKYTIITSSTLMLVGSLVYFDLIWVLTQGGPGNATRILALDMYIRGFQANQMGAASVIGVILVVVGVVLTIVIQRLGGRDLRASQMEGM